MNRRFIFIVEYKGGTYISEQFGNTLEQAITNWSENLDISLYKKDTAHIKKWYKRHYKNLLLLKLLEFQKYGV